MAIAALAVISLGFAQFAAAQYGGVRVQVGGYGSGVRVGSFGYGNGIYSGYGNGYRSSYGNGLYGGYGNGYQRGYGIYSQPGIGYLNGRANANYGYRSYPSTNYGYGSSRYYSAPMRRYSNRRFR